jgi:hypothetical protein
MGHQSIVSSVGPNIRTPKTYEQTKKHAISEELIKNFLPCYFLPGGFYLKSLLFIFRFTQIDFEVFRSVFEAFTNLQEKVLLTKDISSYRLLQGRAEGI